MESKQKDQASKPVKLNRAQRRNVSKKLQKKGFNKSSVEAYMKTMDAKRVIHSGDKVRLNMKQIKNSPDFSRMNPRYISWVEKNKDKALTVEYEPRYEEGETICCFKEDQTDPKWLFWVGDLVKVEEDDEVKEVS